MILIQNIRKDLMIMENNELKLYDINSIELYELIDSSRIKLKRNNLEYKNLYEDFHKIMNDYPNLQLILEDEETLELNKEECKMLQKLNSLHMQMCDFEEREIFFLGAREAYYYFKNIGIIKQQLTKKAIRELLFIIAFYYFIFKELYNYLIIILSKNLS